MQHDLVVIVIRSKLFPLADYLWKVSVCKLALICFRYHLKWCLSHRPLVELGSRCAHNSHYATMRRGVYLMPGKMAT